MIHGLDGFHFLVLLVLPQAEISPIEWPVHWRPEQLRQWGVVNAGAGYCDGCTKEFGGQADGPGKSSSYRNFTPGLL
jgi:hypothetical protein